ncbi:MAG: penicillin-binding protein 1C [Desulfovibrio fairfieldensis]
MRSKRRPCGRLVLVGLPLSLCCAALAFVLALHAAPRPDLYGKAGFSRIFLDRRDRVLRITLAPDGAYRIFTPLTAMPPELMEATLLYEDRSFYRHPGVNPLALLRSVAQMALGGRRMGGSTISMQVVRLTRKFSTASIPGKLRQIWQALVLERHYGKDEILEAYLNLAPYGANVEGVGAAARIWFHKEAAELSLPEILALAPVPQHPAARNPLASRGRALSLARARLDRIWREAHPQDAGQGLPNVPLRVHALSELPFAAPHAVDSLLAGSELPQGRISTTLDLGLQRLLERQLRRAVEAGRLWGMDNAAALLLDWRSCEILALAGSADYFNAAIQGQVDGTAARRSPGSTLKPFIYALALQEGLIHPETLLSDTPRAFKGYEPENADGGFRGPISARIALLGSRNIPAIALASQLPAPGLYGFLGKAGVHFEHGPEHYGLALVLGGAEVSMRELAGLYALLPNRGIWRAPVLRRDEHATGPLPLLKPEAAFVALQMLRAPSPQGFDRTPTYWKTGTSNGLRDAWTAGVFGPYVLVVWVGRFDGAANPGFNGLHAAAPIFFSIRRSLEALNPTGALPDPAADDEGLNIRRIAVCTATGDTTSASARTIAPDRHLVIPGISPIRDSHSAAHPGG